MRSIEAKVNQSLCAQSMGYSLQMHKQRDAKEEYVQAVYRFREAAQANSPNLIALKHEMEFLGRKLEEYRRWFFSGESIEEYVELPAPLDRCPKPAWV